VDAVLRIIVTTVTAEDGVVRSAVGEIDAMTARGTRGGFGATSLRAVMVKNVEDTAFDTLFYYVARDVNNARHTIPRPWEPLAEGESRGALPA
jgi:hypothetical protein